MKKYLGLTLYFVWLVLMSYTFFYFSGKYQKLKAPVQTVDTGNQENLQNQTSDSQLSESIQTGQVDTTDDVLSGLSLDLEPQTGDNQDFTGEDFTGDILTGEENKKPTIETKLRIGQATGDLVPTTPYDDIYEILGYGKLPAYQIPGKDIYLKKLNSVDYEEEKSNINQLIQKIWGNVKETNLFGDKQLFVNPDIYYQKVVIMLVDYNGKLYLVILPYEDYHKYKEYLKNVLFVNH